MSFRIRVHVNIEGFYRKMAKLDQATQEHVRLALEEAGYVVASRARELAPVKTGFLVSTIQSYLIYKWVVKIVASTSYAGFQEFGTRYISPRFFMTRAVEENMVNFQMIFQVALIAACAEAS